MNIMKVITQKVIHIQEDLLSCFYSEFNEVEQAIAFEKQVKGWSRKKKEAIINDNWEILPELSKNRIKSSEASTGSA